MCVWVGLRVGLNTAYPVLYVESGSMCVPQGGGCDGWSHLFEPTLHVGDLLIIEGVNPSDLNANYPNSDIIVFRDPARDRLIVHRIVYEQNINGTFYFKTKGDGNGPVFWPDLPFDFDDIPDERGVPQDLVVGKVILRVPLVGWVPLFVAESSWGVFLLVGVVFLVGFVLFVLPMLRKKRL
ncbi:MAG: signal peptidase I [Candidatus Bathyarchaeota archaeon]|nr:signal peptidase I [Candidatus Bathyarchaeota archaeon]